MKIYCGKCFDFFEGVCFIDNCPHAEKPEEVATGGVKEPKQEEPPLINKEIHQKKKSQLGLFD